MLGSVTRWRREVSQLLKWGKSENCQPLKGLINVPRIKQTVSCRPDEICLFSTVIVWPDLGADSTDEHWIFENRLSMELLKVTKTQQKAWLVSDVMVLVMWVTSGVWLEVAFNHRQNMKYSSYLADISISNSCNKHFDRYSFTLGYMNLVRGSIIASWHVLVRNRANLHCHQKFHIPFQTFKSLISLSQ